MERKRISAFCMADNIRCGWTLIYTNAWPQCLAKLLIFFCIGGLRQSGTLSASPVMHAELRK